MTALFRRYGSISEDVQLDIVSRNLSPFYTTQLPVVNTLGELEEECLKLEAKKYRADHYVPPSRRRHQFVEPDFAFIATDASASSDDRTHPAVHEIRETHTVNPPRPTTTTHHQPTTSRKPMTCWNCREIGHLSRECTKPRKIYCFRCGAQGVTTKSCPKCSSSGNDLRGNR